MIIRKISVGPDYKNSMNYTVGQSVFHDTLVISEIIREDREFTIWVKNAFGEKIIWKVIIDMPVVIDPDLSFAL